MSKHRCAWALGKFAEYERYHDEEWGVPVHDDRTHFEFLILEGAQAGLSWSTILKRRAGYRAVFADFDPEVVASFDSERIEMLLKDERIVRNRLKVHAAVTNAQAYLKLQQEFGSFNAYIWKFVQGAPVVNRWQHMREVPATSVVSDALSKDLKKRGFKFVGSTVIYAHLQACGLVNDHTTDCFRYREIIQGYPSEWRE
jgi:DNA-3-methyladenine glycosylase I